MLAGPLIPAAAEQGLMAVAPYLPGLVRHLGAPSPHQQSQRWPVGQLQDWTSVVAACPTSAAPSEVLLM
jgi:hypothetical protein